MENKKDNEILNELDKIFDNALDKTSVKEMEKKEINFYGLENNTNTDSLSDSKINFNSVENNNLYINNYDNINNYNQDASLIVNNYETNNTVSENKNYKKKYIGYNERLVIHLAIPVILGILSLLFIINSIELNAKSNLSYNQTSSLNYNVGLKPNDYYEQSYLGKGMQYIANLIDYIDVDFSYNFNMNEKLNYKYIYYVKADVNVTDKDDESKVIYSKSDKLTENKVIINKDSYGFNIRENVKVKYDEYNDMVKEFKSSYALDADSNLTLSLYVEVQDEKGKIIKALDPNDMMKVTVPLTEKVVNITMDYKEINNSDNAYVYKEFSIENKFLFVVGIIFALGMVVGIVLLLMFLRKTSVKKSLYEIKLNKILREYDRIIINSRKKIKEPENVIEVSSFEELLDARDNLEKPIVYSEIHKGQKSVFMVKGEKESYKYVLKLADLERESENN